LSETPKSPLDKWLGKDVAAFYDGMPETNRPVLPDDQIGEIIAAFNASRDEIIANKGRFKFKDKLDCVLVQTPEKQESFKIRKNKSGGGTNVGLLYRASPTGWLTVFSGVPNLFGILEPNTLYIGVGKWKEGTYEGLPSYTLTDCRALIKVAVE
jgi:hypothetical protein